MIEVQCDKCGERAIAESRYEAEKLLFNHDCIGRLVNGIMPKGDEYYEISEYR